MRENINEISSTAAEAFISPKLCTVDKCSSGQMVGHVKAPKSAKQGPGVQTLLREAEAWGTSSVPTTYQRAKVGVLPMSIAVEHALPGPRGM